MSSQSDNRGEVGRRAADWFVRLQSQAATQEDWAAFETWLRADDRHSRAFEMLEALWVDLEAVEAGPVASGPQGAVPGLKSTAPRAESRWVGWAALSGAAAALIAGALFAYTSGNVRREPMETLATLQGERRGVVLPDGTRVELNGQSRMSYRIGSHERSAALVSGEAVFSVVHDPLHPFHVVAGDRQISDIGTVFDVKRGDQTTVITVKAGQIAVGSSIAAAQPPITLAAGDQFIHRDGQPKSILRTVDPDLILAWSIDRLVYQNARLDAVVADLNRHFPIPIRIEDQGTAELRFSGVLVLDTEDGVVGRLQAFLPLVAERTDRGALRISRRR